MKHSFLRFLAASIVIATESPPAMSAHIGNTSCDLAVAKLLERVQQTTGVIGFFSHKRDREHGYITIGISPGRAQFQGAPTSTQRDQIARANNLMNSPALMANWATAVLSSCEDMHEVSFGMTGSGHYIPFFRFPDQTIRKGICVPDIDSTSSKGIPFGTYDCTK